MKHFAAGLSLLCLDFPINLLYRLLPQAEIILNFLFTSTFTNSYLPQCITMAWLIITYLHWLRQHARLFYTESLHKGKHGHPMASMGTHWYMPWISINVKMCTSHRKTATASWNIWNLPSQLSNAANSLYGPTPNGIPRNDWRFEASLSGCTFCHSRRWHNNCDHNISVHLHNITLHVPSSSDKNVAKGCRK